MGGRLGGGTSSNALTLQEESDSSLRDDPDSLSDTVVGQTDFDVTTEQCVLSDRNLACAIPI